MKKNSLTNEAVIHLARLAGLSLTEEEIKKYKRQLEETISYIDNLNELNTTNISPTSHAILLTNVFFKDGKKNERALNLGEVFQNTKNKENNYFKVKKIFDE